MMRWTKKLLMALPVLCAATFAEATVSVYTGFYIPYERYQGAYTCLNRELMRAEFGIPLASMMSGIFAATKTIHQQGDWQNTYENINLLYKPDAPITWNLNFDKSYPNGVTDYSFTLDLAALSTVNGSSTEGRQKTINTAKLAIISIVKTAEVVHRAGKFRLWIQWNNLPSGSGLTGAPVLVSNNWPFTSSSSLYQTYRNEMIHPDC